MISLKYSLIFTVIIIYLLEFHNCVELTFELPDNAKECFFEEVKANTSVTIEFQVVTGGQYDVDLTVLDPRQQIIYNTIKAQFDTHTFTSSMAGTYQACFSNEFSTFSHKLIYMDFHVGDQDHLFSLDEQHATAVTQMGSSVEEIHKNLLAIIDYQTHHRLRESQGRKRAEDLNERVLYWSIGETIYILMMAVTQVLVLRNFFTDSKPSQTRYRKF